MVCSPVFGNGETVGGRRVAGAKGKAEAASAAGDSVFGIFESSKKTDVSIGGAERPRWSTMASNRIYIPGESVFTPANHPGFRPRTRVINGSRPRLGYRGTKLRANLPQPYINPDFLRLLSQRSPSSSLPRLPAARPGSCQIPMVQYNEEACVLSCPDYSLAGPRTQIILKCTWEMRCRAFSASRILYSATNP